MSIGDFQKKPLQVEQPLVEIMSKDHECMIRGCFANGTESYQTKYVTFSIERIFTEKVIFSRRHFDLTTNNISDNILVTLIQSLGFQLVVF
jgi:hypothetical protein